MEVLDASVFNAEMRPLTCASRGRALGYPKLLSTRMPQTDRFTILPELSSEGLTVGLAPVRVTTVSSEKSPTHTESG